MFAEILKAQNKRWLTDLKDWLEQHYIESWRSFLLSLIAFSVSRVIVQLLCE